MAETVRGTASAPVEPVEATLAKGKAEVAMAAAMVVPSVAH